MTRKSCCCGEPPPEGEEWFCCDPMLKDKFVTIFDKWMDSAVPVSPMDLIVLKINRPIARMNGRTYSYQAAGPCMQPCKACCTNGCNANQGQDDPCTSCGNYVGCTAGQCNASHEPSYLSAGANFRADLCEDAGIYQCCGDVCAPGTGFNVLKGPQPDEVTNLLLENISIKRFLKKTINKILPTPTNYFKEYAPTTLEKLSEIDNKNQLKRFNKSQKYKVGESVFTASATTYENYVDPNSDLFTVFGETKSYNERFIDKLKNLYPSCLACLENNGYDPECIRQDKKLKKCIDTKSNDRDFCLDCKEECAEFCSAYYGDTSNQLWNIVNFLGDPYVSENYKYLKGATLLDPEIYFGTKRVTPRIKEYMDPLRESLNYRGEDYDLDTLEPLKTEEEYPYYVKPKNDTNLISNNQNILEIYRDDEWAQFNNSSAKYTTFAKLVSDDNSSSDSQDSNEVVDCDDTTVCRCGACNRGGGTPGAAPLYFIYRFTGCHIRWYPPEYIFNYNVRVNQGQGYKGPNGPNGAIAPYSCDYLLRSNLFGDSTGADGSGLREPACNQAGRDGNYLTCGGQSSVAECYCKDRNLYPCSCYRYPHISGGLEDTVKKRFNVSTRTKVGGYIPYQDPFAPPMSFGGDESGCMACYNTTTFRTGGDGTATCTPDFEFRRATLASYPQASGKGKNYPAVGAHCNASSLDPTISFITYNPNYNVACFNRGISPYLSRISKILYPAAREIFHYGSTTPSQQETFGPFYYGSYTNYTGFAWNTALFKKLYNQKSNLFHRMVGLIGIEYHFECWAYHSKALFTPAPPIVFNHARAITSPFERPYGGKVTSNKFIWDPREAFRFNVMRHFPRRVMYGSSSIPLFHSDLYAMELLTKDEPQTELQFDGERFLQKFYLYFYNMLKEPGDTIYNEPSVTPENITDYEEVSNWIKKMIEKNILFVGDHSIPIAEELKQILDTVTAEKVLNQNQEFIKWEYLFPDEIIAADLGDEDGYKNLIQWVYNAVKDYLPNISLPPFGFSNPNLSAPDYWNLYLKQHVSPGLIKYKLINSEQLSLESSTYYGQPNGPSSTNLQQDKNFRPTYPLFAGPRRAKLWPSPSVAGLTAWGCSGSGENSCSNSDRRKSPESALNVITQATYRDQNDIVRTVDVPFEYQKVFSGQEVYWGVTSKGKIRPFGKYLGTSDIEGKFVGACLNTFAICGGILDQNGQIQYPCTAVKITEPDAEYYWLNQTATCRQVRIDTPPLELSVTSEVPSLIDPDNPDTQPPMDGTVDKICNKGKFAVALVEYLDGFVPGPNSMDCKAFTNELTSRSNNNDHDGNETPGELHSARIVFVPEANDYVGVINQNVIDTQDYPQAFKQKEHSNSGNEIFGALLNNTSSQVIRGAGSCMAPNATNLPREYDSGQKYFTLKAWGEYEPNLNLSYADFGIFYQPASSDPNNLEHQEGLWYYPLIIIRHDFNTTGQYNGSRRPELRNKYFIWRDVACGANHTVALTSDGALFATPDSSNFYYQSEYGFPTLTGRKVTTTEFFELTDTKGYTVGIGSINEPFAYYYHYPKPAYFNDMTDEQWRDSLARRPTTKSIIQPTPNDVQDYRYFFQNKFCQRYNFTPPTWNPEASTNSRSTERYPPCDIRCHLFSLGANRDYNQRAQLSHVSDQPYTYFQTDTEADGRPVGPFGYNPYQRITPDAPIWTQVAAGHYHTMALSNDNNLKIWGSYLYVDSVGNPLEDPNSIGSPGNSYFYKWTAVPTFLPEGEIWQDQWTLSGWTLGCGFCGGAGGGGLKEYHAGNPDDIVESDYMVATEANKTIFATREIMQIDGGPDYSIMYRKCRAGDTDTGITGYKFVIWGNMEMVSSLTGPPGTVTITTNSGGLTGVGTKWYPFIDKITAGPNSYGIVYKNRGGASRKAEIFERPGVNIGVQNIPQDISLSDIAFSNTTAGGLFSSGIRANLWQYSSFDTNTHRKIQFNGFPSLPQWFRTHAFFSAVPGTWDFSKWIFGGPCNFISSDVGNDTQVDNIDYCSVYSYKDTTFGLNLSYSGIPQYYWMRPSWRRESPVVPSFSYEQKSGSGCGLLADRYGRDGLRPMVEGGSGVIGEDLNSPTAVANRALNNFFGACFGGDICWVGDGSFSPYSYSKINPESGGINVPCSQASCKCWDKTCGCPPHCRTAYVPQCAGGQPAEMCFKDVRSRIGFISNKDYFIQSCKSFGEVSPPTASSGRCCGVVETNITAFLYAKRNYYFGYDTESKTFKVKNTLKSYRTISNGLKNRTREEMEFLDGGTIPSTQNDTFLIATQVETDTVSIANFLVDNIIPYPPVYVGGGGLLPLEKDAESVFNQNYCQPCRCNNTNCNGNPAQKCSVPIDRLIGPGGWIHARTNNSNSPNLLGQEYEGMVNSSVKYNYERVPTELLPTIFDSLGPLLKLGQFKGPVPDGMSGCSFWRDTSGANTPCGCDRTVYPEGRCPGGAIECTGCIWRPLLGPFGGISFDWNIFSQYGSTGIDVLDVYFGGNTFLPDIPIVNPNQENEDDTGAPPPISVQTQLGNKLFRVYEKIISYYNADGCEYYGDPPAFIGFTDQILDQSGNDISNRPGSFRATCNDGNVVGECMNIRCDDIDPII